MQGTAYKRARTSDKPTTLVAAREWLPTTPSAVPLRRATPSVFHQRYIGRVLRSPCVSPGRGHFSSRGRELRPGRCPPLWPGDLRDDGGGVAAGDANGDDARMDGTLRPDDRRGKEVRRVEHRGAGRLERGARARGSGERRPAAQAGAGQGTVRGRGEAPSCVDGAGIDRRVRVRGAPQARGPWADAVRGALEACRLEAREPAGARFGGGGDAVRAEREVSVTAREMARLEEQLRLALEGEAW